MVFIDANLLHNDSGITHIGAAVTEDEELKPSLKNFVVLTRLCLIHANLPKFIKQKYSTEQRSCKLTSIKLEISRALDLLLNELQDSEDVQAMHGAESELPTSKQTLLAYRRKSCP